MVRIKKETPDPLYAQPKPEFSGEVLYETIKIWQPLSRRTLTRQDAQEIMENVTGFFRILIEWKTKEDAEMHEASKTSRRRNKTTACDSLPKYHRRGVTGCQTFLAATNGYPVFAAGGSGFST
jgi:hypothetical protein